MSLLLQALQKAAKNRDAPASEPELESPDKTQQFELEVEPEKSEPSAESLALAEEEIFEPDPMPEPEPEAARAPTLSRNAFGSSSSPAQAATILRAGEARGQTLLDRVRDRPVHAFAIAAGIFMVFYGAYVYLQLFHPGILRGDFLARPLQAKAPPPAPSPVSPPSARPPQVAITAAPPPSAPAEAEAAVGTPGAAKPGEKGAEHLAGMPAAAGAKGSQSGKTREEVVEAAPRQPRATPARERPARRQVAPEPMADAGDQVSVRVPETRPAAVATGLMDAWQALQEGRFDQAEKLYGSVLQAEPQNVDAVLGMAAIAARQGRTEQAVRHYEHALELEPRNATAQAGLIAIIGQADPQLSETRLKQLIAREPSGYLYFSLGNVHARQGQWPQAQQAYFQAYQLQPDNPDYAYNLAIGLEHLSQNKIALSYYRKALALRGLKGNASFDESRVQERIAQLAARLGDE
jgi:tetratricopeptide (TPR) repeat protein